MNRKEFLKTLGCACLSAGALATLLKSCAPTKHLSANIVGDNLVVLKADFVKKESQLGYIIVSNERLQFPIYLFRFSEEEYTALYLQCTHQGNELSAYGDKLVCAAHGSEFDNKGTPTEGPATEPLRSFPIQIDSQNINISLKAVG